MPSLSPSLPTWSAHQLPSFVSGSCHRLSVRLSETCGRLPMTLLWKKTFSRELEYQTPQFTLFSIVLRITRLARPW